MLKQEDKINVELIKKTIIEKNQNGQNVKVESEKLNKL